MRWTIKIPKTLFAHDYQTTVYILSRMVSESCTMNTMIFVFVLHYCCALEIPSDVDSR